MNHENQTYVLAKTTCQSKMDKQEANRRNAILELTKNPCRWLPVNERSIDGQNN